MASKKVTNHIEITLVDGPLDGKKMEVCYPSPDYVMMGMGRYCYEKINSIEFRYTQDKEKIALLQSKNALNYDSTKNRNS